MTDHVHTVAHMKDCAPCRKAAWAERGGHPVLTGRAVARPPEALCWGPSSTNLKVDRFLSTGDPSVFD